MATTIPGGNTVGQTLDQPISGTTPLSGATSGVNTGAGSFASQLASLTSQSNLAALPYDEQLDSVINATDQAAQQTANAGRIPGGAGLEAQSSSDIAAELAGNLSPGTVSTIEDSMSQTYGGAGFGEDSSAISAAAMRAMGLTAEGQVQAGETNLTAADARNPSAPITSLGTNMVTPSQYSSAAQVGAGTGTGTGGTSLAPSGGTSPYATTANPYSGDYATGGSYTTTSPANPSGTSDPGYTLDNGLATYNPGGSSVFGTIDTGNGQTLDPQDPSGLYAAGIMPAYGSMPDYSNPNSSLQSPLADPSMINNFGQGSTNTIVPDNTVYNTGADTYDYTYGLDSYSD